MLKQETICIVNRFTMYVTAKQLIDLSIKHHTAKKNQMNTCSVSIRGRSTPGGHRHVREHFGSLQSLCYLASGDGVLKMVPPS